MKNGFVVSHADRYPEQAFREVVTCLESLIVHTPVKVVEPTADFAEELSAELKELRTRKKFYKFERGKSLLFIGNNTSCKPTEYHKALLSLNPTLKKALRIIPLDLFCEFSPEKIKKYISESKIETSFKISYQGRLCPPELKEKVFAAILPQINCKVDLDNPKYEIIVQAYKKYVGISVMLHSNCKFNFAINPTNNHSCTTPQ